MRSDVKIGLGVGAVLLVVIVAYLIISPAGNKNQTAQNTPAPTETTPAPPNPEPAPTTVTPTPAPTTPEPTTTTPAVPNTAISITGPTTAPSPTPATPAPSNNDIAAMLNGAGAPNNPTTSPSTPNTTVASANGSQQVDWNNLLNGANTSQTPAPSTPTPSTPEPPPNSPHATRARPETTPPSPTNPITGPTKHLVQRGETLSSIARAAYGSVDFWPAILRANRGLKPTSLRAGQTILLPDPATVKGNFNPAESAPAPASALVSDPTKEYVVQPNDSLYRISMKLYGTPDFADQLYQLNKSAIGSSPSKLRAHQVIKLPKPPTKTQQ